MAETAGTGSLGAGATAHDQGGSAGTEEPECDEDESPKDEPCLIADQYAVFVSADGVLGASGTKESPLPTVSAGIAEAVSSGLKRVIVCADAYPEAVEITAGVSVYGGFSCGDEEWEYTGGATVVQPGTPGEALKITDVSDPVLLQDLEFEAKDAVGPGASSIAAVVKGSQAVVLKGVKLKAGKGMDGADGVLVPYTFPKTGAAGDLCVEPATTMCLAGKPGDGAGGAAPRTYTCPAGDSTVGGLGGDNVATPAAQFGQPGQPEITVGIGDGGAGGASCGSGGDGASGLPGATAPGAALLGSIDDGNWKAAEGGAGMPGHVGQGGGGGGAKSGVSTSGGGGGGGAGGCGGAAAGGGKGGGASIAIVAVDSGLLLSGGSLTAADAGDGGNGADGQLGMAHGGIAGNASGGCPGGVGGAGGKGGADGGGAGGISTGVLWTGTEPAIEDAEYELGGPGNGGQGGDSGSTTADGIAGAAHEVLEV